MGWFYIFKLGDSTCKIDDSCIFSEITVAPENEDILKRYAVLSGTLHKKNEVLKICLVIVTK